MPNLRCFGVLLLSAFAARPAVAQQNNIERVEIQGNTVVDSETYLFHITQKPGDPYDPKRAIEDFHRLWATGFLDDLTLEVTDGERGKIVAYVVDERPRVQALDFVGSKELSASSITEKLTEEKAEIPIDSFYDPAKVVKAEKIIRTMLVDKGRTDGSVTSRVEPLDSGGVKVVFDIKDEQKIRIRTVDFVGIEKFDDWQLRWAMKKTRESHVLDRGSWRSCFQPDTRSQPSSSRARRRGSSAGSSWRSASRVTTTSPRAWAKPAPRAAALPKLRRSRMTRTRSSCRWSFSRVPNDPSVLPSSTKRSS